MAKRKAAPKAKAAPSPASGLLPASAGIIGGRPLGVTLVSCGDCGQRMIPDHMSRCAKCWGVEGLLLGAPETKH